MKGTELLDVRFGSFNAFFLKEFMQAAVLVQAELILQGFLALCLALFKVGDVVVEGDVLIRSGIVGIGIDAVQNAAQLVLLLPQQSVQTIAEPRVEDLHGIGGADGGDPIGSLETVYNSTDGRTISKVAYDNF